jgi:hypothetical protein
VLTHYSPLQTNYLAGNKHHLSTCKCSDDIATSLIQTSPMPCCTIASLVFFCCNKSKSPSRLRTCITTFILVASFCNRVSVLCTDESLLPAPKRLRSLSPLIALRRQEIRSPPPCGRSASYQPRGAAARAGVLPVQGWRQIRQQGRFRNQVLHAVADGLTAFVFLVTSIVR